MPSESSGTGAEGLELGPASADPADTIRVLHRVRASRAWLVVSLALLLGTVPFARAVASGTPTVSVDDSACPGASLEQRIERYLGPSSGGPRDDWTIQGSLRRNDGQWELDLELRDPEGRTSRRHLEGSACETVLDAGALIVATGIDPTVAPVADRVRAPSASGSPADEATPVDPPTPEDEASLPDSTSKAPDRAPAQDPETPTLEATQTPTSEETLPASTPNAPTSDEPVPRSAGSARFRGFVQASAGVSGGVLPGTGFVLEAAAGVLRRHWRVELYGRHRLAREFAASSDPEVGGRLSLWAVGGRGCGVLRFARLEAPLCLGVEGGQLIGEGFGFEGARRTAQPWAGVTAVPGLAFVATPVIAVVARAELGVSLVRPQFVIDNLETLHQTGRVFGRGFIGLEGRFP